MDTDKGQQPRPGGVVEPANRATVAKQAFQTPIEPAAGERYELRDPFAEVTYRVNSFAEMVAKADQLSATKFSAIGVDGSQTTVVKVDGQWKRPDVRVTQPSVREREGAALFEGFGDFCVEGHAPGMTTGGVAPVYFAEVVDDVPRAEDQDSLVAKGS